MENKSLDHQTEVEQMRRDYKDHNQSNPETQKDVLLATIETMEERGISYALIGGIAGKELGRPRVTHDIDIFVKPEDAEKALESLAEKGFKTEKRDPAWLFKAWKKDTLVDVIFKSSGDIYFDEEVRTHVRRIPFKGHHINSISPEDFIVIKAAVHQEHIPHHWHDALAVLTEGNLDWDYFLRRARHAPRRVLSLLIYAQSNDIAVPLSVVQSLYKKLFETTSVVHKPVIHPYREEKNYSETESSTTSSVKDSVVYTRGKIIDALSSDERTADHDIKIVVTDTSIECRGEVFTHEQKQAIHEVVKNVAPIKEVRNHVHVRSLPGPEESEFIQ